MVVPSINNISSINSRIVKIITSIFIVLYSNPNTGYCDGAIKQSNYDSEFNSMLANYIKLAKKLAKKISMKQQITESDVNILLNSALLVLEHIKFNNLYKKFNNVEEIVFKSVKSLTYNNRFEENVIKFTISFFEIFTTLNLNNIKDIVSKSPLELVPLLKEMNVFTKFITANASDYGHSNFSNTVVSSYNKNGKSCNINATKEALMRIMGALINIYLINPSTNKIYKLSNTASTFYYAYSSNSSKNNKNTSKSNEILYKNAMRKLHKDINNNDRVSIFMDNKA
ncbi:MAG: hypothetical protein IJU54_00180 [Alphaproteobacteria bacterium]|nr:hypothetical protein [Alphaproteobacteria bacterium]